MVRNPADISVSRREVAAGALGVAAGATGGPSLVRLGTGAVMSVAGWDFSVEWVFPDSTVAQPGDYIPVTAQVKNTGRKKGSVKAVLGVKNPDGSRRYPASRTIYDIPSGKSRPATLTFPAPKDVNTSKKYQLTIDLWTPNGRHQFDSYGWEKSITVDPAYDSADRTMSQVLQRIKKGAVWGDWGDVHGVVGNDAVSYLAGWFVPSVTPVLDVVADYRDCVVDNDFWLFDALDCSGFTLSAIGSAITVLGVFAGGTVAVFGLKLDAREDVTDLAHILLTFLKGNLDRLHNAALYVVHKFGHERAQRIVSHIEHTKIGKLLSRGLSTVFRVSDARVTKKPVVLLTSRTKVSKWGSQKSKYFYDYGAIKHVLRNADHVYEGTTKQGGKLRFYVLTRSGKPDRVVKVIDSSAANKAGKVGDKWLVDTPWQGNWRSFLDKHKYKLEPVTSHSPKNPSRRRQTPDEFVVEQTEQRDRRRRFHASAVGR